MRYLLFIALSIFMLKASGQQTQIPFKKYGVQEGLPEEYVREIVEDDQGFIWCITQLGAVRFDGYSFQTFKRKDVTDESNLARLPMGLIKGRDGKIWISGYYNSTLTAYDPELNSFNNSLSSASNSNALFPTILLFFEDSNRNIWFNNYSEELHSFKLCRLDQLSNKVVCYPFNFQTYWSNDILGNFQIAESPLDSTIWFSARESGGLMRLNKVTDTFETITKCSPSS